MEVNSIYCGDCFNILQKFPNDSIDLIYIDPPFFTQEYYEDPFGDGSAIKAFQDKWYDKNGSRGNIDCYLEYMEPRLEQICRVLKETGSFYLHCDYHANAHLRISLDKIFGKNNFRNEIIWHYRTGGVSKRWFARKHDTIFFYTNGKKWTFSPLEEKEYYKDIYGHEKIGFKDRRGGQDERGRFRYTYSDDVWEIPAVFNMSNEYLGYPTQKPETLLERIITSSSNPTDIVLDPMCGCGTAIAVAYKLGRRWIGIDVSPTACRLMVKRLQSLKCALNELDILNLPLPMEELKGMDPFEFQKWCIDKFYGRMSPGKSIDKGIDGYSFDGTPIQVKQSERIGRNIIDNFETAIQRKGKSNGIIVGFSFTRTAKDEVARARRNSGLEIKLISIKQLLQKPMEVIA